jgi:hypothetical protein
MIHPLLDSIHEGVPDVEPWQLSASEVASPDVPVVPDLQGPLGTKDSGSNIPGNS